jgi:hypothetical protein
MCLLNRQILREFLIGDSRDREEVYSLPGCDAVWFGRQEPVFLRNVILPWRWSQHVSEKDRYLSAELQRAIPEDKIKYILWWL